ncbi:MAG: class I SAM-dependent methyltransferase [Bdellovibrionaceae bacterium]|nr:class I SAM-dependent methyltransferase [Pseudobdellovibrionaceae bacterium]
MQLIFKQTPRFIVADKPHGLNTHKIDDYKDGFKEFLEQKTGLELGIVSRLDLTTSGLILFPLKTFANDINILWQSPSTTKTYLLVTDRSPKNLAENFSIQSFIEQKPGEKTWHSDPHKPANAISHFTRMRTLGPLTVWQVTIETGKTHQIRLHALDAGIPILGDTKYSGTPYFRLCLHAHQIQIEGETFISPSPFETITDSHYPLIAEFEKRQRLYAPSPQECFRWTHTETSNTLLDQYGEQLFFYVYFSEAKQKNTSHLKIDSIEKAQVTARWIAEYFQKSLYLKPMYDRGKAPQKNELFYFDVTTKNWLSEFPVHQWTAIENDLRFTLKSHQGQSPGLFLDQRENRRWVLQNSQSKKVMNLFAYTGGFSICAAVGKAAEVTTVDLSKAFLEWSKENFLINTLTLQPEFQFWAADTMHFLKGAINKNRKWDLIVCDPPTFGRSDKGVFQIENDIDLLLQNCFQCLNPGGRILFATNFEKWNLEEVYNQVRKALTKNKNAYTLEKTPYQGLDFDFPHQNGKMKSVFIIKIV